MDNQTMLQEIKKNKKYASMNDALIQKEIVQYFRTHQKMQNRILKKKELKIIVKEIRKNLHRVYASYQTKKKKKKEEYLKELQTAINENNKQEIIAITKKLLSIAISTKERLNDYETIYKKVFEITSKPKTIIDLGAGFNPLSFPFMNLSSVNYYAYDIDEQDREFIQKYFTIMKRQGLQGKAEILDAHNLQDKKILQNAPNADIILAFKIIDLLP